MTTWRPCLLTSVALGVGCFSVVRADTITLVDPAGEWHDRLAWDSGRVPEPTDDAVIPAGWSCTIEPLGLVSARSVQVDGVLTLDRETLVLGSGDPDVDVDCPLDGVIYLKDSYANTPPARIVGRGGWLRFTGTGVIDASRSNGEEYGGAARCCAATGNGPCGENFGKGIVIGVGVTLRGSLRMHTCLRLDGDWVIDHPEDVAEIGMLDGSLCGGLCPVPLTLTGSGRIIVQAGRIEIGELAISDCDAPRVVHSGGTITTQTPLRTRFQECRRRK